MNALPVLALNFSALVALCLAMDKHHVEVRARTPTTAGAKRLRALGWLVLLLAFALAVHAQGWGIGSLLWLGTLTATAALLALWLLPYRRRLIVPAAVAAPLLAAVTTLLLR
ncbi:DUF3325 domain-containing protein [Xanthomonas maliensis]|uniref:DUF3325 domain-containing protein n=1 Tax=Xanthomonas maliensis TaxID=1321368 RepID=UPI0003A063F3|nr:DUF3325 domain-containing protein [Xanthomonas maliensis]KAB7769736.1 DUF3325 domain-containing protein [Xanthomonas maliensis]